ncbi:hypothetical protein OAF42_02660 [Planctomicrobium sp.]|jgi:hypothetical protein|nr:hypothetical protein [Planctomicrobium sp.]MDB4733324.1 hypothetical protein [Planctomicrobium sp.]
MEFSFEVDPEVDVAIGLEIVPDESESFEELEFDISGYDPLIPTGAKPGSDDKVKMLAARYSAGIPLWHDSDCYDHGPASALALLGGDSESDIDDDLDLEEE